MTKEIAKKTKKAFYWRICLKVPYEILRFIISIVIARILDPKDFGIVSIATMLIYYSNTITNLGFNHALVQRNEITGKHINSIFTIDITISIIFAIFFYLSSKSLALFFHSPESSDVIKILSFVFIVTTFHELPYSLLRRELNYKVISIIDTAREIIVSILTLLLALNGLKYWSIVWGQIIPLFLSAIYLCYKTKWYPFIIFDKLSLKELFSFGIWSFVRSQIYFISTRIDRLFLGKYFGPEILGYYDKAKSLSQMPSEGIVNLLCEILFPAFSRMQNNINDSKAIFKKSLMFLSIIVFPIFFGLFGVAEQFVIVLLGEKWMQAIIPIQILCIVGLFHTLNSPIESFLIGTGLYKEFTIRQIVATVILIVSIAIIVKWGINFIAVCIVLHSMILFVFNISLLKKKLNLNHLEIFSSVFAAFICSILMLACIKMLSIFYFSANKPTNLFLLVMLGVSTYTIFILLIPGRKISEFRLLLLGKLKKFCNCSP